MRGALTLLLVLAVSTVTTAPLCGMSCHEPDPEPELESCHGSVPEPAGDASSCDIQTAITDSPDCCCDGVMEEQPAVDRKAPASPAPVLQPALWTQAPAVVQPPHRARRPAAAPFSPSGASRLDLLCSYLL